jgi:dihydrofolate synthase / folylpolyglutamate synthase
LSFIVTVPQSAVNEQIGVAQMTSARLSIANLSEAAAELERFYPANVRRPAVYTNDYIEQFLAVIGNPQDSVRVIHVTGTSGKTSTCYYIAALLHAAGKHVGHTSSPHVYALNERVQIGMQPVEESEFCALLVEFLELVDQNQVPLTYFEVISAFSFWYFARQRVDYAVIEVGMGGLFDATNVVQRQDKVAVITDIGLDHQKVLGDTLAKIAEHKAGIIQLKNAVFLYQQERTAMQSIMARAVQKQADVHSFTEPKPGEESQSLPLFQQRNLYLAIQVADFIGERDGFSLTREHHSKAAATVIPGRMEETVYQNTPILLDAAHNAQKLQALGKSIRSRYPRQPITAVVAFNASDRQRVIDAVHELAGFADHIIVTQPVSPDSRHTFEDAELIRAHCRAAGIWNVEVCTDMDQALKKMVAQTGSIGVVTGSVYLLDIVRSEHL